MRYVLPLILLLTGCTAEIAPLPEDRGEMAAKIEQRWGGKVIEWCEDEISESGIESDSDWACGCFLEWTAYWHWWWFVSNHYGTIAADLREYDQTGALRNEPAECEGFAGQLPQSLRVYTSKDIK